MTSRSALYVHITVAALYVVASFLIARFLGLHLEYLAFAAVGSVLAASSSIRVISPFGLSLTLFAVTTVAPTIMLIVVAEVINYDWSPSSLFLDTNWQYMVVPFASGIATVFAIRHWGARCKTTFQETRPK